MKSRFFFLCTFCIAVCASAFAVSPTSVTISPSSKTIDVGKSITLTAELTPTYATTSFTWGLAMYGEPYNFDLTPSGSQATLKANGPGSAYVVVETSNGLQYVAIITAVSREATSIELSYSTLYLQKDDIFNLLVDVLPKNTTSSKSWSTSNANIAKVATNGAVTAVSEGTAIITAKTSNGLSATCNVIVTSKALEYSYSSTTATVKDCDNSEVTSGHITIPFSTLYNGKTYRVTTIKENALENVTNLKNLIISESVTKIGDYAFKDCYNLKTVVFPNSITEIGQWIFYGCYNIDSPIFNDNFFVYMPWHYRIPVYIIPNGIKTICYGAFSENQDVEIVTIPSTVTTLGDRAFNGSNIYKIRCLATNPPYYYNYRSMSSGYYGQEVECFGDTQYNGELYVPSASKSSYMSDTRWKRFYHIYNDEQFVEPTATVRVDAFLPSEGYVSGGGVYKYGEIVKLEATPKPGYKFKYWSPFLSPGYEDSYDNPFFFEIKGDVIYTAYFERAESVIENADTNPNTLDPTLPMFNILGFPVDYTYKGIIIQNGKKFLLQ